jgi:tRNA(fMet)-specific endonuclease VapC
VFLLDTNIAIHALEGSDPVIAKIADYQGLAALSVLSLAELQPGLWGAPAEYDLRRRRLDTLLERIPVLPFTIAAAEAYGHIVAALGFSRPKAFDRMIAAHAISVDAVLVTANTADFAGIADLRLENWALG